MDIIIRPATEQDQQAICALAYGERLNPTGLNWPNFLVAADASGVAGAVQIRKHPDGARELGTLVVAKHARGQGIATRLVDAVLARESGRVQMITDAAFTKHYERWGFRQIEPRAASASVRFNHRIGRMAVVISILKRLRPRRLVILDRPGPATVRRGQISSRPLELAFQNAPGRMSSVDNALVQRTSGT
jgi:GNAT superfamily N-acetyltransferase